MNMACSELGFAAGDAQSELWLANIVPHVFAGTVDQALKRTY